MQRNNTSRTVVKTIIQDQSNHCLVLYRSNEHPLYKKQLDLPGGIVEKGETTLEAAKREIKEETNLDCRNPFSKILTKKILTDQETICYCIYTTHIKSLKETNIKLSSEHEKFKIIPLRNLANYDISQLTDNYIITAINFLHRKTLPY